MTFDKYKIYLYSAIIAIALIIVIYYYGRKSVSKNPIDLPQDKPNSPLSAEEKTQVETLATALYNEMKGVNFFNRNFIPHKTYLESSDKIFVAVYNKFNQKYFAEYGQTLHVWYTKEYNNTFFDNTFPAVVASIINRMIRLKLN